MFWHATREVARKEVLMLLRSKRLLGVGITILIAMILLTLVLPLTLFNAQELAEAFGGEIDGSQIPHIHNGILLFFLSGVFLLSGFFLFQLMPIVLTADAVCSEWQNRRIFLLLSKPVPRPAFVLGKFIGIALPLAAFAAVLLVIDYLIIVAVYPGVPTAVDWGRFFGTVGIITLGVLAFGALSLMFSAITRSSVVSLLLAVLSWIVILPLLGQIQFFIDLANGGAGVFEIQKVRWSAYLSPGGLMSSSGSVLQPETGGFLALFSGGAAPEWWATCIALVAHTAVYLFVAVFVVQVRNFE